MARPPDGGRALPNRSFMQTAVTKISAIYDDFDRFWKSPDCVQTRTYLEHLSATDDLMHPLGSFVILYTPLCSRPPLMLIGNNPSWFHRSDTNAALANLRQVAGKIPAVNSYRAHDHAYSLAMRRVFDDGLCRPDLLDNCVGLNRLWIQTGSGGVGQLFGDGRQDEGRKIAGKCAEGTQTIIELLQPKAVALIGREAQMAVSQSFRSQHSQIAFQDCRHPSHGGEKQLERDLKMLIATANI
jgi:hypothetical protein